MIIFLNYFYFIFIIYFIILLNKVKEYVVSENYLILFIVLFEVNYIISDFIKNIKIRLSI